MDCFTRSFNALGSRNEITIYSDHSDDASRGFTLVENEVRRIEEKYSRYRAESIVSRINDAAGNAFVDIDDETEKLFNFADACYRQSHGLFDITSGALRRVWNFREARIPERIEIEQCLSCIGWEKVQRKAQSIFLPHHGMEIDFGGFGKEYAVDQAAAVLQEAGFISAQVNLGGDLRVIGVPPGRAHWKFGIADPRNSAAIIASLEITAGALASSGDYERFFEIDGARYCHIINPKTGMPVSDFRSISVLAPATLIAGSCTTIAMLLGKRKAQSFLRTLGFPYLTIDSDGRIETNGLNR